MFYLTEHVAVIVTFYHLNPIYWTSSNHFRHPRSITFSPMRMPLYYQFIGFLTARNKLNSVYSANMKSDCDSVAGITMSRNEQIKRT